jgi:hypothetical protein
LVKSSIALEFIRFAPNESLWIKKKLLRSLNSKEAFDYDNFL